MRLSEALEARVWGLTLVHRLQIANEEAGGKVEASGNRRQRTANSTILLKRALFQVPSNVS